MARWGSGICCEVGVITVSKLRELLQKLETEGLGDHEIHSRWLDVSKPHGHVVKAIDVMEETIKDCGPK